MNILEFYEICHNHSPVDIYSNITNNFTDLTKVKYRKSN